MWVRIRAVIIEDEPLAAQYLVSLLDETCQVEVVGSATESEGGLQLCADLQPDAAFVDIRLPATDGVSLATRLAMLPRPPLLVFTTGDANRAADAFRLGAVDYLLKPLDPDQVTETVNRLLTHLRPFVTVSYPGVKDQTQATGSKNTDSFDPANELLAVKDKDRDQIRLLSRREIVALIRRERRTWVHTVREEFPTYYPLTDLIGWLGGHPFIQIARHAAVNLRAIESITHYGDRLYRVRLRDRAGTELTASRSGASRLAGILKTQPMERHST
jgi:two-component system, LytTR family, response regulator LytT